MMQAHAYIYMVFVVANTYTVHVLPGITILDCNKGNLHAQTFKEMKSTTTISSCSDFSTEGYHSSSNGLVDMHNLSIK